MQRFFTNWLPVILCSTILLYLCTTEIKTEVEIPYVDKVAHLAFYAFYSFLLMRALEARSTERILVPAIIAVLVSALYGGGIEWIQYYIPGRSASLGDEAANFTGACFGAFLYSKLMRRKVADNVART